MDIEQILDAYRSGDTDKRLSLFLGYRELRDEFNRIEQDDGTDRPLEKRGPKWLRWIAAGFL